MIFAIGIPSQLFGGRIGYKTFGHTAIAYCKLAVMRVVLVFIVLGCSVLVGCDNGEKAELTFEVKTFTPMI